MNAPASGSPPGNGGGVFGSAANGGGALKAEGGGGGGVNEMETVAAGGGSGESNMKHEVGIYMYTTPALMCSVFLYSWCLGFWMEMACLQTSTVWCCCAAACVAR